MKTAGPKHCADNYDKSFSVGTFRERQFTKDDVQQLQLVANRIGLAIEPLLKYWKITSSDESQIGHVCTKHLGVRREQPVKIRVKEKTILIKVTQSLKSLIYINFTQRHIFWRRV